MKTLMRNGRDRRSENPLVGHAKKERVSLFGTDQRITSGPAAKRPHSKAGYMTAPERFADSQIPLAMRAPSIHDPKPPFIRQSSCKRRPDNSYRAAAWNQPYRYPAARAGPRQRARRPPGQISASR